MSNRRRDIKKWFRQRTKAQVMIVTLLLSSIATVGGPMLATERFAKLENYHPMLNQVSHPKYIKQLKRQVYNPWAIYLWKKRFYKQAKRDFDKNLPYGNIGMILGLSLLVTGIIIVKSKKPALTSHGTARWATEEEMESTGLTKQGGTVLGVTAENKYIRHDGAEHIAVYAPTRSGKGVGIILPTLLAWSHSVLVIDIKGENYAVTAGFRKFILRQKVFKFDPTAWKDPRCAHFNPLNEIRVGTPYEVKDTQNIVSMIIFTGDKPPDHWIHTASALLTGLILYVLYCEEDKTMSRVADIVNNPVFTSSADNDSESDPIGDILRGLAEKHHSTPELMHEIYGEKDATGIHPKIWNSLIEAANKPQQERGSVISTMVSHLALYRDPIIRQNIENSDFSINDLMNHETPVSLYIVIPPGDIGRVAPLTRIIINQVIAKLTEKMEFKDARPVINYKHRLLLLLDEFPAMGRIDTLEQSLAFIAGYGLKVLLIFQSLNQLKKTYTENNSILDNCHIRVAFTPNDLGTAKELSETLGDTTIMVDNFTYEKGILSGLFGARKSGKSAQSRRLMTHDEIAVMPEGDEIIMVTGAHPYKAKKVIYWKDKNFVKRLMAPPEKSDSITNPEGKRAPTDMIATIGQNIENADVDALGATLNQMLANLPTDDEITQSIMNDEFADDDLQFLQDLDAENEESDDLAMYVKKESANVSS